MREREIERGSSCPENMETGSPSLGRVSVAVVQWKRSKKTDEEGFVAGKLPAVRRSVRLSWCHLCTATFEHHAAYPARRSTAERNRDRRASGSVLRFETEQFRDERFSELQRPPRGRPIEDYSAARRNAQWRARKSWNGRALDARLNPFARSIRAVTI